ncbi:MAG: aminoglycoside phosphotransferase family protein [Gammaproteobacteria bacterium]|nr:aminoglycoside phosphotransferase family protein [Gammaproteobacteria bacterium]
MNQPTSIRDNIHFLTSEIGSQLKTLEELFTTPSSRLGQRLLRRHGYAASLMLQLQNRSLEQLTQMENAPRTIQYYKAVEAVAAELKQIGDHINSSAQQLGYLKSRKQLHGKWHARLCRRLRKGVGVVAAAMQQDNVRLALAIGRIEQKNSRGYRKLQRHYTRLLQRTRHADDLVTALLLGQSCEQMGDSLQKISETLIATTTGQSIDFERYDTLLNSVSLLEAGDSAPGEEKPGQFGLKSVAETRSGSTISGVTRATQNGDQQEEVIAILKEGDKKKVQEERDGAKRWEEAFPGISPRLLNYQSHGKRASLLLEHLNGLTLEHILLHDSSRLLHRAISALERTLKQIWTETQSSSVTPAAFTDQLSFRLDDLYAIHPNLVDDGALICGHRVSGLTQLILEARRIEVDHPPPFSVLIHGDFNLDNIIYDDSTEHIAFIDLHRSRQMDFIQDISVFMVSGFRLQVFDHPVRTRIQIIAERLYHLARKFARSQKDDSFEIRLTLGLARSFITSTRFILDQQLAGAMYHRGRYLLEYLIQEEKKGINAHYTLPVSALFEW